MDRAFSSVTQAQSNVKEIQKEIREIEKRLDRKRGWFGSLPRLASLREARESAETILSVCGSQSPRDDKRKCFDLLKSIRDEAGSHSQIVIYLQRLIDRSFFHGPVQWQMYEDRKRLSTGRLRDAELRQAEGWQEVRRVLNTYQSDIAAADDEKVIGNLIQFECFDMREGLRIDRAGNGFECGVGAGVDDYVGSPEVTRCSIRE